MKILHVTNMYPVPARPYFGVFVKKQYESLRAHPGVELRIRRVGREFGGYRRILGLRDDVRWSDLVHCHFGHTGTAALIWRFLEKKPMVVTYCGDDLLGRRDPRGGYGPVGRAAARVNSVMSVYADCAVVQSEQMRERARSGTVTILPYGVDTRRFRPPSFHGGEKNGTRGRATVLFLGQKDNPVKNYGLMEKALACLGDVRCLSLGGLSEEEVVERMNSSDVCVLTSHHEGSPVAVREAMACDRPVVSVDAGDVGVLLEGLKGSRVVERDPRSLAEAVREAICVTHPGTRQRLFDLGLDIDSVARKLADLYRRVLGERGGASKDEGKCAEYSER